MRGRLHPLLVCLLAGGLLLGACGGSDDAGDTASAPTSTVAGEAGSGAPAQAAQPDGAVEVLDTGREPRQPLRFAARAGTTFRSRMTMAIGLDMTIDGRTGPTPKLPAVVATMTVRVDEVTGGVARYSFTYDEVGTAPGEGIDPQVRSQYEASLRSMKGLRGTGSIDELGNAGESTLDTSAITDPNLRSTLDGISSQVANMTVPFPSEAVGVGARWKGTRRTVLNGITSDAATTYTLRSRDADRYVLEVRQDVTAPLGPVDLPGLGGGSKAELLAYAVTNTGEVNGDLARMLPTTSRMTGGGDIRLKVTDGGRSSDIAQKLSLDVSLAEA